jgi:hypothetical protein
MQSTGTHDEQRTELSRTPIKKEPLQVRIPTAIKRRFKSHAALLGIEPNELFVAVWEHYEASQSQGLTSGENNEQND